LFQPETYAVALSFMLISMVCWGSWANTIKLCPKYRFQLFYWDYILGLIVASLIFGFTLGSMGSSGRSLLQDIRHSDARHILFAVIGGAIFNIANLLLVAAIDIAGLAVAFPVGIGLALVIGAISNYVLSPNGNPILLFGGITLVVAAIAFAAIAYRSREAQRCATSARGVIISLVAGLLMGIFYPFVSRSMSGVDAPGPYAVTLFFALGAGFCAIPFNYMLMRHPLDRDAAATMSAYWSAPSAWHVWGMLGGAIWCTGAVLNFVASRVHIVGPAVSYSIGQGATMISAAWGVFIWREFAEAPRRSKRFLVWMFVFFLCGLSSIALAPILWK
jgi:glucose uptake protein